MKEYFPRIGLAKLCGWFGVTRQAYYKNNWDGVTITIEEELILQQLKAIRKNHRVMGGRKLYDLLRPFIAEHQIKIGRDALFKILSANGLLVRKRKSRIRTTNSYHWMRRHPNIIKGFVPTAPNQLWVSDITYWKITTDQHLYISFITDAYSHQIVGYHVAETLETIESIQALNMALSTLKNTTELNLIHHSDRGLQYCSNAYVALLKKSNIQISMTESGDPLDNAIAERINGIIKEEYLLNHVVKNLKQAKQLLKSVINLYNNERPHMSIGNLTPNTIHYSKTPIETKKLWKNYYQKRNTFVNQLQD
jgi:transposase InsO family protein